MKFSLQWIKEHVELLVSEELLWERLTEVGTEVESVTQAGCSSPHLIVAQIKSFIPHPNADRLRLCQVDTGKEVLQIVCGATNFSEGDLVALATSGAVLPGGFKIKDTKLRGELSQGMICSSDELSLLGKPSEGILLLPKDSPLGVPFHEVIPTDTAFDIEITPNRSDLCSYQGLAREMVAAGIAKSLTRSTPPLPSLENISDPTEWEVKTEVPEACPFYTGIHLGDLEVKESPAWLRIKIEASGHSPINNVVDITNFILWELGQPLHAFDASLLADRSLFVRYARDKEELLALDDNLYSLVAGSDLVIADSKRPIALAGVIGGKETGVNPDTKEIFLESAWFDPSTTRRQARHHSIITDSSYRFERRVDPKKVLAARNLALELLQDLAGAKIISTPFLLGTPPQGRQIIELRTERIKKVLGFEVETEEISTNLQKLGLTPSPSSTPEKTAWTPPSYRWDLEAEIDLIEEIARLGDGLKKQKKGGLPFSIAQQSKDDKAYDRVQKLRHSLSAIGFQECLGDSFLSRRQISELPPLSSSSLTPVEVLTPLSEEYTHLRHELSYALCSAAAKNLSRGNENIALFEVGKVFSYQKDAPLPLQEKLHLGFLLSSSNNCLGWWGGEKPVDFYDIKGVCDFLEREFSLNKKNILTLGKVDTQRMKSFGFKAPVFYAEFTLDPWLSQSPPSLSFSPIPTFPSVRRDVALLVDKDLNHQTVLDSIKKMTSQIPCLERIEIFDVFSDPQGVKLEKDKKSLAYALFFRSTKKTLNDTEVNNWNKSIKKHLSNQLKCQFR